MISHLGDATNLPTVGDFPLDYSLVMLLLHPGRLTWNLKIHQKKDDNHLQTIIFRFYVNLPGL